MSSPCARPRISRIKPQRGGDVGKHQLLHLSFIVIAAPYFCSLHLPLLLFAHPSPLKHHRLKSQSRQETPLIAIPSFFSHVLKNWLERRLEKPLSAQWKAWQAIDLSKRWTGRQQMRREEQSDGVGWEMGGIKYAVGEKDREIGKIVKKKKKSERVRRRRAEWRIRFQTQI